jgi:hypothetical protein
MSATVTCKKLAAAFKAASEEVFYTLFESTYETNVHPHTPDWSCIYFGDLKGAIRGIFFHASECEGGMLQNRSGRLTPEGYIAGWLKELNTPARMPDYSIRLQVKTHDPSYRSIPKEHLDAVCEVLTKHGSVEDANNLCNSGETTFSLHNDAAVLSKLVTTIAPWRIIESYRVPEHHPRDPALGYSPRKAVVFDVTRPAAMKVDDDNRLIQSRDGSWYCAGWQYSIVGHYVRSLWEHELEEPGSFRKRIESFREALAHAPPIPPGTKVVVDESVSLDKYQRQLCARIAATYPTHKTPAGYEVVPTKDNLYDICHLDEKCATWILPSHRNISTQLSLL